MDSQSPQEEEGAVRLDLFFPLAGVPSLPSLRGAQAGNRCLVVGPRGR